MSIPKDIAVLKARESVECIVYSQGIILHAYLKEVRTDNWGIRCSFEPIPTTGLPQPHFGMAISVIWDCFFDSSNRWGSSAQGATWWIFFGEDLIREIVARAHQLSSQMGTNDQMMHELRKVLSDYHWGAGFDR